MSYNKLFDDVSVEALQNLVHSRLLFKSDDEPGSVKLTGSSLSLAVPLFGERYAKRHPDLFDLRISKSRIKALINEAHSSYSKRVCSTIALLYRTGLGLPQSRECYLLWNEISCGYAPKVKDRIYSYRDMLYVLKEHWRKINKESIDPEWLYFDSQNRYYRSLLNSSFPSAISDADFWKTQKPAFTFAKYSGIDCSLVYRLHLDGSASLYAAYSKVRGKFLNFTVQALKAKHIPNQLPAGSVPKSFGPYVVVSGTVTIKARSQRHLCKEWGDCSCLELIKQAFSQDVYSLAEHKNVKLERSHPSVAFCRKYSSKYRAAKKYLKENKGSHLSKSRAVVLSKAQSLVDRYNEAKSIVDAASAEYDRLREYEIFDCLQFVAYDIYGYSQDNLKYLSTSFEDVLNFINSIGFVVTPIVDTKAKTVNSIYNAAKASALRGYCVEGLVARMHQNGKAKKETLNWVKLKL